MKLIYVPENFAEEYSDLDWIRSADIAVGYGFGFEGFSDNI